MIKDIYNCIRKMIIETSEMDKEAYESGLFLSDSVHDLQYNIESLRKEINSCFNWIFQSISVDEDDKECFWLTGSDLHKINLKDSNLTPIFNIHLQIIITHARCLKTNILSKIVVHLILIQLT